MIEEVVPAIKALLVLIDKSTTSEDALKFSQAALNVANCGAVLKDQQE